MTALRTLRFLDEEVVGFRVGTLAMGRTSDEGPELHEAEVPLPLSDELLGVCFAIWSFGRFLLPLLRLEDELLRFLVLERFGFGSFRRRLEDFRED